jgi:hypothetical protein
MSRNTDTYISFMAESGADRRLSAPGIGTEISSPLGNYLFGFLVEIVSHESSGLLSSAQR